MSWSGVELGGGSASPTPDNIAAVMELYPVGERSFQESTLRQVLLNAAKSGCGPSLPLALPAGWRARVLSRLKEEGLPSRHLHSSPGPDRPASSGRPTTRYRAPDRRSRRAAQGAGSARRGRQASDDDPRGGRCRDGAYGHTLRWPRLCLRTPSCGVARPRTWTTLNRRQGTAGRDHQSWRRLSARLLVNGARALTRWGGADHHG